ncbi:hypothetical protein [Haloarcula pellucida]|uniref:Uncharacterized protein n=1 Tax=Haloarcula pellucida TaxID=1427151 RepID=A0A830GLJ4_9EURY|nr:hypothetical protein [Halomicroarcula pellucida]MBX0350011.1 hypothetical protein [Halomicroarcula pellucida]GGN95501.1 hypothetical protein GCM10009030_22860 [Halomicroarcula pellucida]
MEIPTHASAGTVWSQVLLVSLDMDIPASQSRLRTLRTPVTDIDSVDSRLTHDIEDAHIDRHVVRNPRVGGVERWKRGPRVDRRVANSLPLFDGRVCLVGKLHVVTLLVFRGPESVSARSTSAHRRTM